MGILNLALKKFHGGVHPKENKDLAKHCPIEELPMPKRLYVPLQQHSGTACEPCVKPGDKVFKGQLIGRTIANVSSPVHAPTSGTIEAILDHVVGHYSGLTDQCVVLLPDGNDQWDPSLKGLDNPFEADSKAIRDKVRDAGVVGLGGAVYPTHIKLSPPRGKPVDVMLINGVECEPYITNDTRIMEERSREIVEGAQLMMRAIQCSSCLICIEANKPGAIQAMEKAVEGVPNFRVVVLPVRYPQGAKNQLIEAITHRQVPSGGRSTDTGATVQNVATSAAVRDAVLYGRPLIRRVVTVSGRGIVRPANLDVPIGTPIQDLIDHCGGLKPGVQQIIMNGPMMGTALHDLQSPVVKATAAVLAFMPNEIHNEPEQPCIRCGNCLEVCPVELTPCEIVWRAKHDLIDQLPEVHVKDCIECGSCAYACPANIPLVHYIRYGKMAVAAKRNEKEKTEMTRLRNQAKLARLEAEKAEKERKKEEMRLASEARKKAAAAAPKPAADAPAAPAAPAPTSTVESHS
ncbi:MAG: electron transport complex subunit RsxC [Magnetococcales bacterium]|nr:electron transport complex subunit RsxC [Magnetococcales bacterium]